MNDNFRSARPPLVLSIAGYDPSSGAGITADVKTAAAHGCFAATCVTALTVQSSQGVRYVYPLYGQLVRDTLDQLAADMEFAAVRVGMLGTADVAAAVADFLERARLPNVVLDPIIRSSSGAVLLDEPGIEVLRSRLIPLSTIVTPNADEAGKLTGMRVDSPESQRAAARRLRKMGAANVAVTGGHLDPATDLLLTAEGEVVFGGDKIESNATHGTGCAFAMSLACKLALGASVQASVEAASAYVRRAIRAAYPVGQGTGPLNHFA